MLIDNELLESLAGRAQASPRLRMDCNLRNSVNNESQRMLNTESGTVLPTHQHPESFETVVMSRGKIGWVFYDDKGIETERVILDANGEPKMPNVECDR